MGCCRGVALVLLLLLLNGCKKQGGSERTDLHVSFQPALLPIEIVWSGRGGFSIGFKAPELVTPLGRIGIGIDLSLAKEAYPSKRLLVIVLGKESFIYELHREDVTLQLPNNISGRSVLRASEGNIYLYIPHPERLGAPTRLDAAYVPKAPTVRLGTVRLRRGFALSLALGVTTQGRGDLTYLENGSFKVGDGFASGAIKDLGPVAISTLRQAPLLFGGSNFLHMALRPFTARAWADPVLGHTYAISTGTHYALAQVVGILPEEVSLAYRFQSDGTREFWAR